jgi:phage terminase large subunit-like protein
VTPVTLEQLEQGMSMQLLPWQKEVFAASLARFHRENKDNIVLNCGRKTGKTTLIEFICAYLLLNEDVGSKGRYGAGLNGGICVVSAGQDQAKEILAGVASVLAGVGVEFAESKEKLDEGIAYLTTKKLVMPGNMNRLLALPAGSNATTIRPYSFHAMFYDEDDFFEKAVHDATASCMAKYNGMEFLESTPNPKGDQSSYFAQAFFGKLPNFRRWMIPTKMVPHVSAEWLHRQKMSMPKSQYEREFECKFTSDADVVFNNDILAACRGDYINKEEALKTGTVFLGVDIARFGSDDNVIAFCFFDTDSGTAKIAVEVTPGRGTRVTAIEGRIRYLCETNRSIEKIVIDENGVGAGVTDSLVDALGVDKVLGMANQKRVQMPDGVRPRYQKTDNYVSLLRLMEQGKIKFDDDIRIIRSLMNTRYEYTKRGDVNIWGNDSHIAEAIVRAVYPMYSTKMWYGPVDPNFSIVL